MRKFYLLVFSALLLAGCGDGDSRTNSSDGVVDLGTREINMELNVGEHRDINLELPTTGTYSVSSRVLESVGNYNATPSCNPSVSASEVGVTRPTNVSVGTYSNNPAMLRVIGVYPGNEVVCTMGGIPTKINIKVVGTVGNDIIGGSPTNPNNPGTGGGDPNTPPPIPGLPNTPGSQATKDPEACTSANYYYVDDDYNDVEGHFSPDAAVFLRSLMPGNVDSRVRIYYPVVPKPATITYTNLGQYGFEATNKNNTNVIFEMQMAQHLFGKEKKHFYILSNDYCMRGNIPASVMTPPDKTLTWVTQ